MSGAAMVTSVAGGLVSFDLATTPLREVNQFLHTGLGQTTQVRIDNPDGAHSIAVGMDAPVQIDIAGNAGYYAAGMNKHASVTVHGNAGPSVAENMMSGTVRVADLGTSQRETHTHLGCGAGVGVDWTKNFGARLEYERLRSRLQGESVDVDQVTAGIVARF